MALTRANVETILVNRVGALMTLVGLDGTTVNGTNTDLNDAIGYGINYAGGSITDVSAVTSTDCQTVTDQFALFDIAEFRVLQTIMGNYTLVDTRIGPRDEKWSQLQETLNNMLANKKKMIESLYDFGLAELSAGILELDFAEHDEDNTDDQSW